MPHCTDPALQSGVVVFLVCPQFHGSGFAVIECNDFRGLGIETQGLLWVSPVLSVFPLYCGQTVGGCIYEIHVKTPGIDWKRMRFLVMMLGLECVSMPII